MIEIIRAERRHFEDLGWLRTYWLFSFDTYHDPDNIRFSNLRVFNDDVINSHTGFGKHPHREMEIVTIVLSGEVSHEDSMGNKTTIKAGEVQRMSAGTGITHSEYNNADIPLHLYQIWILPHTKGLKPSYEQKSFVDEMIPNTLIPVVSGNNTPGALSINADAKICLLDIEPSKEIKYHCKGRKVFIYITSGSMKLNDVALNANDQVRVAGEESLILHAVEKSSLIVINLPNK
jgi:redox-sensitive bicupin YhaK (pirin superfamily)